MFAPHQIVCLECHQTQLYGEVIQVLEDRQMCWVRPIVLVHGDQAHEAHEYGLATGGADFQQKDIQPISEGPDLLWPLHQFRLPLDTEVLPLLATVQTLKPVDKGPLAAHQQLRQFIERLWMQQAGTTSA